MKEHEELQNELADYAASRLEGEARLRLEAHLKECDPCREMASVLAEFGRTLREGGESLFELHPSPSSLREFALGSSTQGRERVARHLERCASCTLEIENWKRAPAVSESVRVAARTAQGWKTAWLLAAGVVIGVGLASLARIARVAPQPEIREGVGGAARTAGPMLILPRVLRGAGDKIVYTPDWNSEFTVLACLAAVPDDAAPEEKFVYTLLAADKRTVWSQTMTAQSIRERIASPAESVTLLVPTASLRSGRYEFSLSPEASTVSPIYRIDLEVVESQPPPT